MCWREEEDEGWKRKIHGPVLAGGDSFNNVTSYQRLLSHRRWQFNVAWRWFQGGRGGRNGQVNWIENKRCQRHVFIIQTALIAVARRLEQQPHLNRIRGQNMQKLFKHTWKTRSSHQAAGVWHTGSENGCQWNAKPLTTHHLWLKIFIFFSLYILPLRCRSCWQTARVVYKTFLLISLSLSTAARVRGSHTGSSSWSDTGMEFPEGSDRLNPSCALMSKSVRPDD